MTPELDADLDLDPDLDLVLTREINAPHLALAPSNWACRP